MDTNEQEPVGGEDVSSSQDTSADIAQPTETEEVVDGNQSEEVGEAPSLLAGKYKSPEELEKAHLELQKKLGEQGQKAELVNLLEKQTGMNHQQIKDFIANQERQRMAEQIKANPGLAAFQEVQELKSQLAYQNEERELDGFLKENPEYAPFRDKILKLGLNLERDKPYDEIAREYFGESRAQGQQDAYQKIEQKRNTQATGASQAAPKSRLTPEDMDKMTAAELEAILPHADISNRLY
jgi:hypothetical protein